MTADGHAPLGHRFLTWIETRSNALESKGHMLLCPHELVQWMPFPWTGPSGTESQGQVRADGEGVGLEWVALCVHLRTTTVQVCDLGRGPR